MRVLLTGFEPFRAWKVNPSQLVVEALAADPPEDVELTTAILTVSYEHTARELRAAIDRARPDLVLMLGQGGGTTLRVERIGVNLNHVPGVQDNRGRVAEEEPIDPTGPDACFATIPVKRVVEHLVSRGVPAAESWSAGTFLCNHALFVARRHVPETQVGFIHLPLLPEQAAAEPGRDKPASMAVETAAKGVREALVCLAALRPLGAVR